MFLYVIVGIVCLLFSVYSYALIDPNITFFQNRVWVGFRDAMVQFGYYQRENSWWTYAVLLTSLSLIFLYAVRNYQKLHPVRLAFIIVLGTLLSYPFLSHDFFNYMFDAKIFTFYHQNPYLHKALDFPGDQWLRFMHWTHRTYPYGPTYILISFLPSFLGLGKFSLTFFLFKAMNAAFYFLSVKLLAKVSRKWAVFFAANPLIIIEGLVNGHNDMAGLGIAVAGVCLVLKNKAVQGKILTLISAGIKYINAPTVLLGKNKTWNALAFLFQAGLLGYLSLGTEIQPWYFLAIFAFLPFFGDFIGNIQIFIFGLLVSYYPYIRLGGWDTAAKVALKHEIILVFLGINVVYILFRSSRKFFTR